MTLLGAHIEALIGQAQQELLLVAPFIKLKTLARILDQVHETITVQVITRWRADEIALGVSDLDVYLLLRPYPKRALWLRSDLHAKYYRGDQNVLVGSANLTNAALGWSQQSNLELLIESPPLSHFEEELFAGSVLVDDTIYEYVKQSVAVMPMYSMLQTNPLPIQDSLNDGNILEIPVTNFWLPLMRSPDKLYLAYLDKLDDLGAGSRVAAISDLIALEIPLGLKKDQFESYVSVQLLQKPIIRQIDQFVKTPQRFGAVTDFLRTLPCAAQVDFDAVISWQTVMRWLLHFLPKRYELTVARHSEIFRRIT